MEIQTEVNKIISKINDVGSYIWPSYPKGGTFILIILAIIIIIIIRLKSNH